MKPEIKIFSDKDVLIRESSVYISGLIRHFIKENNLCTFVLAGGSTPKGLYQTLASEPYKDKFDWTKVHLFWGDERCVPPDHSDSNYRMAKKALIDHIDIPQENVHRIPAEKEPAEAAREYEGTIKRFFDGASHLPVFDIILLGIGEDGHTASLFPGTEVIDEKERWVKEVYVPNLDAYRITLTFPVINSAKNIIFLVAGEAKAEIASKLLKKKESDYPAAKVEPKNGKLVYILDKAAAINLENI